LLEAHGSAVGSGIMLQAGRSRVRDPIRSFKFSNLPNPSSRTMALRLSQPLTQMSTRKCFWGVERGWRVRLTTLPPSVSRLYRQCGIHILQTFRLSRPVTRIALLYLYSVEGNSYTLFQLTEPCGNNPCLVSTNCATQF
jgi:hypothetical protein